MVRRAHSDGAEYRRGFDHATFIRRHEAREINADDCEIVAYIHTASYVAGFLDGADVALDTDGFPVEE